MYHRIQSNQITASYPPNTREIYLPEIDRHIPQSEFEAHGIYKQARQSVDLADNEYITGYDLQVIDGRPVEVAQVKIKSAEQIAAELEAWRENASLPRHIAMIIMRKSGVKSSIQASINGIADTGEKANAQDAYDNAPYFRRNDAFVKALGPKAGLTDAQIDDLFRQGGA